MSGTVQPTLSSAELAAARRYSGYPAYGGGQTGFQSWRFFQAYGTLEYRLANLSADELAVARNFLGQLQSLENGLVGAAANLDTEQAAVWTHNPNELADRSALYTRWRREFVSFLGIPPGPGLASVSAITV